MKPIIEIQNIGKRYSVTKGKEPYLSLRDRFSNLLKTKNTVEDFWALQHISFDIYPGESLGIIGKNGAGKSTLLKILSKITPPTEGRIVCRGRIASLLEVGTGFHPELTGRENIFLNGSILGLKRAEINRHFDAIVDFSGVEKFIDTPLKRFSSGMQLRLAFAVAAHLEPEILIIDEVLAVGDAEFQKKCLGKMGEVSKSGRTVIFVSHDLEAVMKLCPKSVLLESGRINSIDISEKTINTYLSRKNNALIDLNKCPRKVDWIAQNALFTNIKLLNETDWTIAYGKSLCFEIEIETFKPFEEIELGIAISTLTEVEFISSLSTDALQIKNLSVGKHKFLYEIQNIKIQTGFYQLSIGLRSEKGFEDYIKNFTEFEVLHSLSSSNDKNNSRLGLIVPNISITHINK